MGWKEMVIQVYKKDALASNTRTQQKKGGTVAGSQISVPCVMNRTPPAGQQASQAKAS